jgi:hypothetical protein
MKENNMYQLINQNYHCSLKECNTSCQTEAKQTIILFDRRYDTLSMNSGNFG